MLTLSVTLFPYTTLFRSEPMLLGILKVLRLPPQCTYWRFLASLPLDTARQLLQVQREMRERVWLAANHTRSRIDRKSTRLNSSPRCISFAALGLKKTKNN